MSYVALIPAAGVGARMLSEVAPVDIGAARIAKQYHRLAGRPMLYHSIRCVAVPPVATVFVVLAPGDTAFAAEDWSEFDGLIEPLYCGGQTRRDSVRNGLLAAMDVLDVDDWVLVHDAARPCLPRADLERLIAQVQDDAVGGLLGLPVAETVKRAAVRSAQDCRQGEAEIARVAATEERDLLWLAQTPQMFRAGLLGEALRLASGVVTDEASAVEQMGLQPRLVAGSRQNLKVTYRDDLAIAEAILGGMRATR